MKARFLISISAFLICVVSVTTLRAQSIAGNRLSGNTPNGWGKGGKPKPTPTPSPIPGDPNYTRTTSNTAGTADQWSAGTNWDATPTSGATTQLVFGNGAALAAGATIFTNNDLVGNFQLNILNFTYAGPASGAAPTVTISGSPLEFVSNGATTPTMTFNATGTVKPVVTITNDIVLTNNLTLTATTNGTLSGTISGAGSLNKLGTSTLTLSGPNTFSGGVIWGSATTQSSAGLLSIGSSSVGGPGNITSGPLGTGTLTVRNNGAASTSFIQSTDSTTRTISNAILFGGTGINFNTGGTGDLIFDGTMNLASGGRTFNINNTNTTFSNTISGVAGGTLTKGGTGTLILSKATGNTYTAGTSLSAGSINVQNTSGSATGSGAFNFTNAAATTATLLSGAGTTGIITGLVTTANTDSTITPGGVGTVGALTLSGGLTATSGATFKFDLGATNNSDLISLSSGVFTAPTASNSGLLKISFGALSGVQSGATYKLFSYGSQTNLDAGDFSVINSPAFAGAMFTVTGSEVDVTFTAVPEPSTYAAAALAFAALCYNQRRRFKQLLKRA
ncbi:MAG TPA: hypothetical protein VH170_04610 [Chthoniobacterales bacterium]|nr:hypothetical protein [Chthoniobacterales bacterium]